MIHTSTESVLEDRSVLREQIQFVARIPRREVLVILAVGWLTSLVGCVNIDFNVDDVEVTAPSILHRLYFVVLVAAGLWAAAVWHDEGPRRRGYRSSLPVERGRHELLRVAAGGFWLLTVLSIVTVVAVLGGAVSGQQAPDAWMWVSFVSGPVTVYLLASIVAVRLDAPGRWVAVLGGGALWL